MTLGTTSSFYDLRTFAEEKNGMFKKMNFIETSKEVVEEVVE